VTISSKRGIEDHFDHNFDLESTLKARGKDDLLAEVRGILPKGVSCIYIRQPEALGLGHAVLCAKNVVGNHPFAIILADDLIDDGGAGCLSQMMALHDKNDCSILGVERIDANDTEKYGVVKTGAIENRLGKIEEIVEKPKPDVAPSNLAVVGRYILSPRIFEILEGTGKGAGGEIQLTDAIAELLAEEDVMAYEFEGKRYDCGDKLGYLTATVEYALKHPQLKKDFLKYLGSYCLPTE